MIGDEKIMELKLIGRKIKRAFISLFISYPFNPLSDHLFIPYSSLILSQGGESSVRPFPSYPANSIHTSRENSFLR